MNDMLLTDYEIVRLLCEASDTARLCEASGRAIVDFSEGRRDFARRIVEANDNKRAEVELAAQFMALSTDANGKWLGQLANLDESKLNKREAPVSTAADPEPAQEGGFVWGAAIGYVPAIKPDGTFVSIDEWLDMSDMPGVPVYGHMDPPAAEPESDADRIWRAHKGFIR